ncbi:MULTISPECIES: bile acid:sodium symporter [Prochlorococcus]|uniref:bile acid:sodium symporter n=1 Tax=Prochlorococcus TaxID=1218 RepID=UPI0007B3C471|nr:MULTISPECIES: bile acid:sodium symporter [Prochlorococcus]KZR67668.1 Sodium Bile acid symporter family protein [Prochlorococcus marinus str. MIT 1312]NMO84552.1 transporter [Prochlorococcus sp. P1344]NMP05966.1 transporter [Prochlorococcus sp. P1361]NMP13139.1 transporter [Prochlorococcus sp.P1363]
MDGLIPGALFLIMFALGLNLRDNHFDLIRNRSALLLRVLLGTCVLVPLVAMIILWLPLSFELSQPARLSIALMAVCPSASLTLRKAGKAGGNAQMAGYLQMVVAIAAIISIPLMAELFTTVFKGQGWEIRPIHVAMNVGQVQILPLLLGLLLRRWLPAWSESAEPFFNKLANLLLLLVLVVILVKAFPLLIPFASKNLLALALMAVMVIASLLIRYLLAGPDPKERTTVSLVTSLRNPCLALLFAQINAPQMLELKLSILTYLVLTIIFSIPFLNWRKRLAMGT